MRKPQKQKKPLNDLSRSLTPFDPNQTLTAVIELSKESWLVAGVIPGVERQPLKKVAPDQNELLKLLERWRAEAEKAGHKITRITVAFEAGRDGFWLARWLRARGIEAHVMHAASVAVTREHRRAKTDRLLSRNLRDRRAVARYGGLTGSPDESGSQRREKGLARSGNARVRKGMIQFAWRFLQFQKESTLAKWFEARTKNVRTSRKKMIVALARKLLIALWRFVRDGVVPEGVILRPAH